MEKEQKYKDLKILLETHIKFKKAKNLAEFKREESITVSEFLEGLLEPFFRKFDDFTITKVK